MNEPDWTKCTTILVAEAKQAIDEFGQAHKDEICSFFAFSVDCLDGVAFVCLDTLSNSLHHAKRHESRRSQELGAILNREYGWKNARQKINSERITAFIAQTGDFKYNELATLNFPEWEEYFGSDLPDDPDPSGHVVVVLWNAIQELVADEAFKKLKCASPFRLGFEIIGDAVEGLMVTRIQNWPPDDGLL